MGDTGTTRVLSITIHMLTTPSAFWSSVPVVVTLVTMEHSAVAEISRSAGVEVRKVPLSSVTSVPGAETLSVAADTVILSAGR